MLHRRTASAGVLLVLFVISLSAYHATFAAPAYGSSEAKAREVRMGRESAREVEKEQKLITDPDQVERVNRLGQAIAAVANSEVVEASYGSPEIYDFEYKFKIVDDPSVNAFSLPGGYIYVHKGLLDYVQSDHELAGVLAHEIAHASHHHMTHLLKEQSKLDGKIALVLLAGMIARVDTNDLGNLLVGAQLVRIAKSSGYGQRAENDADAAAVVYATKAGYNPVGVLTFLERLAHDYACTPNMNLGILQTHPAPKDRCKAVKAKIEALRMPINRRAVTKALKAEVRPTTINGVSIAQIRLGDRVLFEPAPVEGVLTSEERASAIVTSVNQALDAEPVPREVTVGADGKTVMVRGETVLVVTPEDSRLSGVPASDLAQKAAGVLRLAIWSEMLKRVY